MFGKKSIFKIIRKGTVEQLEDYLEQNPDKLDAPTKWMPSGYFPGMTPLAYAAAIGKAEMVKALIKAGADVNKVARVNTNDYTPLFLAVDQNHEECVKVLMSANARTDIKCRSGMTVLELKPYTTTQKLIDPNISTPAKVPTNIQKFIYENEHMVSFTEFAEQSNTTITTFYNFADQSITRKIKDADGVCACMQNFNQAANRERLDKAAEYLEENKGNTHGYKMALVK